MALRLLRQVLILDFSKFIEESHTNSYKVCFFKLHKFYLLTRRKETLETIGSACYQVIQDIDGEKSKGSYLLQLFSRKEISHNSQFSLGNYFLDNGFQQSKNIEYSSL